MKLELQPPSLPRCLKMSSRFFECNARPEHHSNVECIYCQIYFETVDTVANCIAECFNQNDYTIYANCEQVLLKENWGGLVSQNVNQLCEFYTEFDSNTLQIQLSILAGSYHSFRQGEGSDTLHNVIDIWSLITEVMSLVKIILVIPATNASSERTFSALRRVKSYLRTTILNSHLSHLMTCTHSS